MKLVVFGLSITSTWGNGHATLWRGLCSALASRKHRVVFFERDVPYYAAHRDWSPSDAVRLVLYRDWCDVEPAARRELADADAAIVTSYCHDALAATAAMLESPSPLAVFYDLDTPVTLDALRRGNVPYIGPRGLADYDLVLSFTGGPVLRELSASLGARRVVPLYGHVDPHVHHRLPERAAYRADLSYLGTYARDRQQALERLFVAPAKARTNQRFVMGGAQYPDDFPWLPNVYFVRHLPAAEHGAFYASSTLTLNVTRHAMAVNGWCPSGRLFEAAACGACIVSDAWPGLDQFYAAGTELLVARDTEDVLCALDAARGELHRIGAAARTRTLDQHTSVQRAIELEALLCDVHTVPASGGSC